jgi:ZIP family zinc transporter
MATAALWGFVANAPLLLGAAIGLRTRIADRVHGLLLAFAAGALISAVGVNLAVEALDAGAFSTLAAGLAVGAIVFVVGNVALERRIGRDRKVADGAAVAAGAIALGALLDGVPESAAIGISLAETGAPSVALIVAVAASGFPESVGAAHDARVAGQAPRTVLLTWGAIVVATTIACVAGSEFLTGGGEPIAFVKGIAAGAILAMLADTLIPEAYQHGGRAAGLVTVLGFAVALFLSGL